MSEKGDYMNFQESCHDLLHIFTYTAKQMVQEQLRLIRTTVFFDMYYKPTPTFESQYVFLSLVSMKHKSCT